MGKILELAEAIWKAEEDTFSNHPFGMPRGIEEIAKKIWFYRGFSNSLICETEEGLIIVDPGAIFDSFNKFKAVRTVIDQRLHTAIFTHGIEFLKSIKFLLIFVHAFHKYINELNPIFLLFLKFPQTYILHLQVCEHQILTIMEFCVELFLL